MKNEDFVKLVGEGVFPETQNNSVPIDKPFVDDRGEIFNLWLGNSGSVSLITTKAGKERASHYHTDDFHMIYVLSGSIKYLERDIEGKAIKEPIIVKAGGNVFSKPNVVHKIIALEDTTFLTVNGILKNEINYAETVKRVEF